MDKVAQNKCRQCEYLRAALFQCYTKDLCYPKIVEKWTEDNKCLGMCAITALVVNDFIGGGIGKNSY